MKRSSSGSGCDLGPLVTPGPARPPIHPGLHRPRFASVRRLGGAPPRCGGGEAGGVSTVGTGRAGAERRSHSRGHRPTVSDRVPVTSWPRRDRDGIQGLASLSGNYVIEGAAEQTLAADEAAPSDGAAPLNCVFDAS